MEKRRVKHIKCINEAWITLEWLDFSVAEKQDMLHQISKFTPLVEPLPHIPPPA